MPLGSCTNANGQQIPCGPEDIGQTYYQAMMSQDPAQMMQWYQDLLGPFTTQLGENTWLGEGNEENWDSWLNSYGMYFAPMEFDMQAYNRIGREARLKEEAERLDFFSQTRGLESQRGTTGFTSAYETPGRSTLWSDYRRNIDELRATTGSEYQSYYGSFGQNYLNMIPALAAVGAFTEPELGNEETVNSFGFESLSGEQMEYTEFGDCYTACVDDGNPHWECATACLD